MSIASDGATAWPAALVLDLDGTLIDSAPDIALAVNAALAERDIATDAVEVRRFIGDGARRLVERVFLARDLIASNDEIDTAAAAFKMHYQARPCEETVCYPGAHEMLASEHAAGRRLAICTNKPQPVAARVLSTLGLDDYIHTLVGAGQHPLKPDPAPIIACLDTMGVGADDALYVGDMPVDATAARAAGLPVVLARFGYAGDRVAEAEPDGLLAAWADWPALRARLAPAAR